MNSIPLLFITHYNRPDLLVRCVRSLGNYPIDRLLIIQNGPDDLFPKELPRKFDHIKLPNYGVGAANNLVFKTYPEPWWFSVSNDIEFAPGDLYQMAECAWKHESETPMIVGNHAAAFFIYTMRGVKRVGLFDENFYPFYMEDYDLFYRCKLAGENIMMATAIYASHGIDGKPSSTIQSSEAVSAKNRVSFGHSCQYYRQKWGGDWQHETHKTPYNIPGAPIDYWHYMPELRKLQQW